MAKYVVSRTDGKPIPEDEPCFIIRAQDEMAYDIVEQYRLMASARALPQVFVAEVREHRDRILRWQNANPDKVKRPD